MRLCRSVISRTMIDDVKGVRVMPVRNPTIPERISRFVFESLKCIQPDKTEPMQAPELSAGANIPPAAPVLNENIEPVILITGAYHGRFLLEVNNIFVIIIFPEPISSVLEIKPSKATINPQINTNIICCFLFFKRLL